MDVSYRKNLNRSYMCIEDAGQLIEPYELMMLENHRIPGLIPLQSVITDGRRRYLYDISGKQQIEDYFSGKKVSHDVLRLFLVSIQSVCRSLSENLLREEGVCLEMEFIYVDLEDGSLQFLYLPFYEKNLPQAFELCMEQLLRKIDHQDKEAVELGYQVYQLCAGGHADIGGLLEKGLGRLSVSVEDRLQPADGDCASADGKTGKRGSQPVGEGRKIEKGGGRAEERNDYNDKENAWQDWVEKIKAFAAGLFEKYDSGLVGKEKFSFSKTVGKQKKQPLFSGRGKTQQGKPLFSETGKKQERQPLFPEGGKKQGGRLLFSGAGKKQGGRLLFSGAGKKRQGGLEAYGGLEMPESLGDAQGTQASEGIGYSDSLCHPTEILGVRMKEPLGKLTYQGVHQCSDIRLEGESFLLGKNQNQVNGVISAEGVSRLHARITKREQKYFIEDLNSTNGTYINDMPLEYRQPKEIYPGDRIRFGAEEYVFS